MAWFVFLGLDVLTIAYIYTSHRNTRRFVQGLADEVTPILTKMEEENAVKIEALAELLVTSRRERERMVDEAVARIHGQEAGTLVVLPTRKEEVAVVGDRL